MSRSLPRGGGRSFYCSARFVPSFDLPALCVGDARSEDVRSNFEIAPIRIAFDRSLFPAGQFYLADYFLLRTVVLFLVYANVNIIIMPKNICDWTVRGD